MFIDNNLVFSEPGQSEKPEIEHTENNEDTEPEVDKQTIVSRDVSGNDRFKYSTLTLLKVKISRKLY